MVRIRFSAESEKDAIWKLLRRFGSVPMSFAMPASFGCQKSIRTARSGRWTAISAFIAAVAASRSRCSSPIETDLMASTVGFHID